MTSSRKLREFLRSSAVRDVFRGPRYALSAYMNKLLVAVLLVASAGLAFSGLLAYRELFASAVAPLCVPVGEAGTVLGVPPCVYGFFVYLALVVLALIALLQRGTKA